MSSSFLPEGELEIFGDYLNVEKDLSLTFYYINLLLPLFVAIILVNVSIGYFFPTFKGVYSQSEYSSFSTSLQIVKNVLNILVFFFALVFIYLLPLMKVGESIGMGSYVGVYNNFLPLVLLNLVLIAIYLLANTFTKFNYQSSLSTYKGFFYCDIDPDSKNNLDSDPDTCKRTNWQTIRDSLLCSVSDFASNMSIVFGPNTIEYGGIIAFVVFAFVILGGILKQIYMR